MRLDKFLWFARFARTRSLAQQLVADGQVRLDGRRAERAALPVRVGSVIVLVQGGQVRALQVAALPVRRGPAPEAATLYTIVGGIDGHAAPQ